MLITKNKYPYISLKQLFKSFRNRYTMLTENMQLVMMKIHLSVAYGRQQQCSFLSFGISHVIHYQRNRVLH